MDQVKMKEKEKVKIPKSKYPKILDVNKFFGVIKWEEDAVTYQRKLRDGR